MGWIVLVVAILVLACLLYLGNRSREQRRLEKAREAEKLESQVSDHREMSADHQAKAEGLQAEAEDLREKADREMNKAARHEVMADEIDPNAEDPDRVERN